MKPGNKFLFILISIFLVFKVIDCTTEESIHKEAKALEHKPKNRYIVEKTHNVTEKREPVLESVDDGFQESFRKVRKVHRKLINNKLHQYDETEDLERKRIKDSGEAPKKNIAEVQHVIQKMKIVENPNDPANKQKVGALEEAAANASAQKQNAADDSETQKTVIHSDSVTQDGSKVEDNKQIVANVAPSTKTKTKTTVSSETGREEETIAGDPLKENKRRRTITYPGNKGKRVIRTIYVTNGKNAHSEEERDNLESEYENLTKLTSATISHEGGGIDAEKSTNVIETEENNKQNKQALLLKQRKITEVEDQKDTESEAIKPSTHIEPVIKTRRIIIRRPLKIIRKNISRSAKEEEQKEKRREEETVFDRELHSVPVIRKKKIITTSETEKDQSKNLMEGTEDSETVIEKPEGQKGIEHITITRIRSGKDTKRSDKTNTEDVEIITDSEEPTSESKISTISKPKLITRRIITETTEGEGDTDNEAKNRENIVNVIDNTNLDSKKKRKSVNQKEGVDVSTSKQNVGMQSQKEQSLEVHTEKTISQPISKDGTSQILETETVDKSPPNAARTRKITIVTGVKPRKVRVIKKKTSSNEKDGAPTAVTKSKSIVAIEEEIRRMLSEESHTEKPKVSQQPKSTKGKKKTIIVTKKSEIGSETPEIYPESEMQEDDVKALKTGVVGKKVEIVKTTTTIPRIIIKDKTLTEVKMPKEDAEVSETTRVLTKKNIDIMEPGTGNAYVDEPESAVFNKEIKSESEMQEDDDKALKTGVVGKKVEMVKTTTTIPRIIIKDKTLTEVKMPKEDAEVSETTRVLTKKNIDIMEPGTGNAYVDEPESAVFNKEIKSVPSKDDTKITETDKKKPKKIVTAEDQKGSFRITETDTDKKATVVQDMVEPYFKTVKKISVTEPETQKKVTEIDNKVEKQPDETDKIDVKSPKIVRKVIIRTETTKGGNAASGTQSQDTPVNEIGTPSSVIVKKTKSDAPKEDHTISDTEHVTKKEPDEKNLIDKTVTETGPKIKKKIITTTTTTTESETEKEHDGSKVKLQEERTKPSKETRGTSESGTIIVKDYVKREPEMQKEDTAVPEVDVKTEKVKHVKETKKAPESSIVIVKHIEKIDSGTEKEDTETDAKTVDIKPVKETEKSPESTSVIVKRIKKTDSETQIEDTEGDAKTIAVKPVKETEKSPESTRIIVKTVRKSDSETQKEDTEADAKTVEIQPVKETETSPESTRVIVKRVKKTDSETHKEDIEPDTKTDEVKPVKETEKSPESTRISVKTVKKTVSETQKEDTEPDAKTAEVKPVKETEKSPESTRIIVKTVKKTDSGTQKEDTKPDAKTVEVHPVKETEKSPESTRVIVKTVKKTDSETQKEDTEPDTKTDEVKPAKETEKSPESTRIIVKTVKKTDSGTQKEDTKPDAKTVEVKPVKESEKSPESTRVIVKTVKKTNSETQKEDSEPDAKTVEVKPVNETEKSPEPTSVMMKRVEKIDSETQKEDTEPDAKTVEAKPVKETEKSPESTSVIVKRVKQIDSQSQKENPKVDTQIIDVKTTKETENTPEFNTEIVRLWKIDSETEKENAKVDTKTKDIKPNTEPEKVPESSVDILKRIKKIDSETPKEDAEVGTKTNDVKPIEETKKIPESSTVIVKKTRKIGSETEEEDDKVDTKTHEITLTKTQKIPESRTITVKKVRKMDSDTEKDFADVSEVNTKEKFPSSEIKPSKTIEKSPETSSITVKKVIMADTETQKDEVQTKADEIKPIKEPRKTPESGTIVVTVKKETINAPVVYAKTKEQSDEVRPSEDTDNTSKIRTIIVKRVRKPDSDTEKESTDVSEADSKDHDQKLKKQPGHSEIVETRKVIQSDKQKDHIKEDKIDSGKENQDVIVERINKGRNIPAEAKTRETVVTSKIADSAIENEEKEKKTEGIHFTNEAKGDAYLKTTRTKMSGEIEDAKNANKEKHLDDADVTKTKIITSESEKDNVNTDKHQKVVSGGKENKDRTLIIKSKTILAPEKISVTSEQVKTNTKTQEDLEQLVEKDEVITDTQVIEEEVEDDSAGPQDLGAISKQGSNAIIVKTGAQETQRLTGVSSQEGILTKSGVVQNEIRGAAGKVTAGGKRIIIPKLSKRMRGLKGRQATEYLFMLENDAEAAGPKDPSVAAELMSKLKVSNTKTYTTYHVNRGKEWTTNDDLSALMKSLEIAAMKIRSANDISIPYLETVQELQRISTKYIQDGYQASTGTQVKLNIKQFEKLQDGLRKVETSMQSEGNVLVELAVKAICEIRSGMFKMECFKEQYPAFGKFLSHAEPDKKDCYGNVRKLSEWTKAAPELWKNKERRLKKLQTSLENLQKNKQENKTGKNLKKSIASLLCDTVNYMDVQAKYLDFSTKLEGAAKQARREINICNKKEPVDPALADADK